MLDCLVLTGCPHATDDDVIVGVLSEEELTALVVTDLEYRSAQCNGISSGVDV